MRRSAAGALWNVRWARPASTGPSAVTTSTADSGASSAKRTSTEESVRPVRYGPRTVWASARAARPPAITRKNTQTPAARPPAHVVHTKRRPAFIELPSSLHGAAPAEAVNGQAVGDRTPFARASRPVGILGEARRRRGVAGGN